MNQSPDHRGTALAAVPDDTAPWPRITVDSGRPGAEFEPRPQPPGQSAFDVPDTECDGWSTADFTVRYASVRGAGPRFYREARRECARVAWHEPSGAVVFAVADEPQQGAAQACRAAIDQLLCLLAQGSGTLDFDSFAHHTAERLRRLAPPAGMAAGTLAADWYATTLVAGVVQPEPGGPRIQVCRIGDSGAWLLDRTTGSYHALFKARKGADSHTEPVEHAVEHLTDSEILLVGSNGFGDPLGDGDGEVGELFARHLAVPPTPLRLAHVLDFAGERFDDDRTLVAVWPADR
ncbi:hypothetical protein KGQ19_34225 [Catenulispora sp. NL8]|uniref:PPM-type phosphatase domain-containing protein n=1 Tax=Catenulispora pinistramenti TaxID=2705254 RepID=A0ABS5L0U9_9ACTN|nr:hypothetical protein [Catenulispora pinistramenti]MBS2551933.1 hypothetical protein [Catenulispora pinistramenti]